MHASPKVKRTANLTMQCPPLERHTLRPCWSWEGTGRRNFVSIVFSVGTLRNKRVMIRYFSAQISMTVCRHSALNLCKHTLRIYYLEKFGFLTADSKERGREECVASLTPSLILIRRVLSRKEIEGKDLPSMAATFAFSSLSLSQFSSPSGMLNGLSHAE